MDLIGSLIDTKLRIYPSSKLLAYLKTIKSFNLPSNIKNVIRVTNGFVAVKDNQLVKKPDLHLSSNDVEILSIIKQGIKTVNEKNELKTNEEDQVNSEFNKEETSQKEKEQKKAKDSKKSKLNDNENNENNPYLTVSDIDWLYLYLQKSREKDGKDIPYLHELLEGVRIETPDNQVIKRNPVLEARCVKLRAQQEAREYRHMTKTVDNVRMNYPEDSIGYQIKQMNRQLIAIGQFIISIFAGFLFGFRGVEWMVGNLDIGFRLLLGVMCALIIALAEIYFLAKKLNEELNIVEATQLGGPPIFSKDKLNTGDVKPHMD